jgi:3'-phosphoadenosine 5'-phosphosulfate sulfotransferase (PAPS reductase)/FAD synthetase
MSRAVHIPEAIERELAAGAALVISISGGKDSQALARAVSRLHRERGWTGPLAAVHADLGRIEWPQTPAQVRRIAEESGLDLVVVQRRGGAGRWDMVDRWRDRAETLKAQGKQPRPWSDAGNRFCTAEMKRDPINTYLRRFDRVVSVEGIRAQESTARAKKPCWDARPRITTRTRIAHTWNAILDWSIDDVLEELGSSVADLDRRRGLYEAGRTTEALDGWQAHPVYVMGNQRLSCAFCVLGCKSDLANAARHNPVLLGELVGMEQEYGFTFQNGRALADLRPTASRPSSIAI